MSAMPGLWDVFTKIFSLPRLACITRSSEVSEVRTNAFFSERGQLDATHTVFKSEEVLWVHSLHEDTAALRQRDEVLVVTNGL